MTVRKFYTTRNLPALYILFALIGIPTAYPFLKADQFNLKLIPLIPTLLAIGTPLLMIHVFEFTDTELRVYHSFLKWGRFKKTQTIPIKDIAFCYSYSKERQVLQSLRGHLKRKGFKIPYSESDYSFENLNKKYKVSDNQFNEWLKSKNKLDKDLLYTEIVILMDFLESEYNLSKSEKQKLENDLNNSVNHELSYFKNFLKKPITENSFEFINCFLEAVNINRIDHFLKIDPTLLEKYHKTKDDRIRSHLNDLFVFSSEDGSEKIYTPYFFDIPLKEWKEFFSEIRRVRRRFQVAMPKHWVKRHVFPEFSNE